MSSVTGKYSIDIPASAKLKAGWFTDRFKMKPGHLEEVEAMLQGHAEAICDSTLTIDEQSLTLSSDHGDESFPIINLPSHWPAALVVNWHGQTVAFDVVELADGVIQFRSEENELAAWAWRKVNP